MVKDKKLTFVRDLKVEELINILSVMQTEERHYKNRDELTNVLLKKKDYIFPTRKSVSYKSAGNTLITLSNLNLIDNHSKLNNKGKYLAKISRDNKKTFLRYLSNILLFEGNWIMLIRAIEKIEKEDKNSLKDTREITRILIKEGGIKPGVNIRDMASRIRTNYIGWLEYIGLINITEKGIKVNRQVISEIKTKFKLPY